MLVVISSPRAIFPSFFKKKSWAQPLVHPTGRNEPLKGDDWLDKTRNKKASHFLRELVWLEKVYPGTVAFFPR